VVLTWAPIFILFLGSRNERNAGMMTGALLGGASVDQAAKLQSELLLLPSIAIKILQRRCWERFVLSVIRLETVHHPRRCPVFFNFISLVY
jgi:hypothetical protein